MLRSEWPAGVCPAVAAYLIGCRADCIKLVQPIKKKRRSERPESSSPR